MLATIAAAFSTRIRLQPEDIKLGRDIIPSSDNQSEWDEKARDGERLRQVNVQ